MTGDQRLCPSVCLETSLDLFADLGFEAGWNLTRIVDGELQVIEAMSQLDQLSTTTSTTAAICHVIPSMAKAPKR